MKVNLPHDWSIEEFAPMTCPFSETLSEGGAATGYSIGGLGAYQRTLEIAEDGLYEIVFEGVYNQATVSLDGQEVATNNYGYVPITIRKELSAGEHVLKVRVRNAGANSRWYSGSGIYRSVWMRKLTDVRLATYGLFVTTPSVSPSVATVNVQLEAETEGAVAVVLLNPDGSVLEQRSTTLSVGLNGLEFTVKNPALWFPWDLGDQPLYKAVVSDSNGVVIEETVFGIRKIELDAEQGLRFNGKRTRLKGGCVHHDHGVIGSVVFADAETRRITKLKEAGYNAIRTSHNPPSVEFLEACDRLGFVVMDEVFDEWEREKNTESYYRYFAAHSDQDLTTTVRRDRNHPCVAFWSIGNEIPGTFSRPDIAKRLRETTLASDPTRLVTAGVCSPWWKEEGWVDWPTSSDIAFEHLDVAGINYLWKQVESDHARNPQRTMMHTETFPLDSYETWSQVQNTTYVVGDFVWTCWDYIGESGIGCAFLCEGEMKSDLFPWHVAVCGDFDLIGTRKPQSYFREAVWQPGKIAMATTPSLESRGLTANNFWHKAWGWSAAELHWNWEGHEGEPITVEVYASCESVELFLNGKSVGMANTEKHRASFEVPYARGELKVIGSNGAEFVLRTAGKPISLASQVKTYGSSLVYVEFELQDAQGVRVPTDDHEVQLVIHGPALLEGFGNGSPLDVNSLKDHRHSTYQGRALAVLRRTGEGEVSVTASLIS